MVVKREWQLGRKMLQEDSRGRERGSKDCHRACHCIRDGGGSFQALRRV